MTTKLFTLNEISGIESDNKKCDFCNYHASRRFLMAESTDDVIDMVNGTGAYDDLHEDEAYNGFCGDCIAMMLAHNSTGPIGSGYVQYTIEETRIYDD